LIAYIFCKPGAMAGKQIAGSEIYAPCSKMSKADSVLYIMTVVKKVQPITGGLFYT